VAREPLQCFLKARSSSRGIAVQAGHPRQVKEAGDPAAWLLVLALAKRLPVIRFSLRQEVAGLGESTEPTQGEPAMGDAPQAIG
jgi:hypothetical protein